MTIHDRIRAGEFDNKLPLGPGPRGKESLELNKAFRCICHEDSKIAKRLVRLSSC